MSVVDKDLKLEEIKKVFKRLPRSVCWVSFTGGEPYLRDDLIDIFQAAVDNLPRLSLIGMPSNGLMTERILSQVKKLKRFKSTKIIIGFSLDGPPEIHDKIRGIPGGFKRTWKTYQECIKIARQSKNLEVMLEMTLSPFNINHAYAFLEKLLSRGHKVTLTISHAGFLYNGVGKDIVLSKDNLAEIDRIVKLYISHISILSPAGIIERKYLKNINTFLRNPEKQVIPCKATSCSFALLSDGSVMPCFMWGVHLGNLREADYDVLRLVSSKKTSRCRAAIKKGGCPVCWTPCEAYQSIISSLLRGRIFP
jgi:MoaA/NifB/PqqE/SkfB family radical SAM enzyme